MRSRSSSADRVCIARQMPRIVLAALLALFVGACDDARSAGSCVTNGDCSAGATCIGGRCSSDGPCTTTGDCAAGEICLAGRCAAEESGGCVSDTECGVGRYCDQATRACADIGFTPCDGDGDCPDHQRCNNLTGVCIDGSRSCVGGAPCPMDQHCDPVRGQCVVCLDVSHCAMGEMCVNGACQSEVVPPPDAGISLPPDAGVAPYDSGTAAMTCNGDPECAPPATICESNMCRPGCTIQGGLMCGANEVCNNATGRCQVIAGPCMVDGDCSPPMTVCELGQCVNGCGQPGGLQCNVPMVCDASTGRCIDGGPICLSDADCNAPTTICNPNNGQCEDGCAVTGCTAPLVCDAARGHCSDAAGCAADAREDDDTAATAAAITAGMQSGLTSCAGDEDHFALDLTIGDTVTIDVRFAAAEGNVDVELRDPSGAVVASGVSTTSDEQITFVATAAGAHTIRVWLVADYGPATGAPYSIEVAVMGPPCARDALEPNDDQGSAAMVTTGATPNLQSCMDEDWYRIDVAGGDEITVELDFSPLDGDVDLQLRDAGGAVLASSTSVFSTEQVRHTVAATGTYYIRVWLGRDIGMTPGNPYSMTISVQTPPMCVEDRLEDNDDAMTPAMIGPMSVGGLNLCPGDDDWFAFSARAGDAVTIDVLFTDNEGDVDAALYDPAGAVIDTGVTASDNEQLTHDVTTNGTYAVRVYLYGDGGTVPGNTFSLDLNIVGCTYDSFEPNDAAASASPVTVGSHSGLGICDTDNDYFTIDLDVGDQLTVDALFSDPEGDVDLELRDASGGLLDESDSVTDNEQVSHTVTTAGTYVIRVLLYRDAGSLPGNAYALSITR